MDWRPQLATLIARPPDGPGWLHELKLDGYRIVGVRDGDTVRLVTRAGHDWTATLPHLADAVRALPCRRTVLDGEVVALLPDGRSSFQALQTALGDPRRPRPCWSLFELLALDDADLRALPLRDRKERLRALLPAAGPLRYVDHVEGNGPEVLRHACLLGAEGIVSKRADAPHRDGRSRDWLKAKCTRRQELVIGGFTDLRDGSHDGVGALLVGAYDAGRLTFAGKVGSGFTVASGRALRARLDALRAPASPFSPPPPSLVARAAHWVRPELVAEVRFAEWTDDGRLRHPVYLGLREDKPAADVVRERPA